MIANWIYWVVGAIVIFLFFVYELHKSSDNKKMLNKPLTITSSKSPFYITEHRLILAYKELSKADFMLVKIGVRSLNEGSVFEKTIDALAKLLFTTGIALIAVIAALLSSLLAVYENDELKVDLQRWVDDVSMIISAFNTIISQSGNFLTLVAGTTLCAIIHFGFAHERASLRKKHLVIIDEVEKERS
ncbi:hypothetical protein [Paenibacillus daejeonensis]|uniref:hypothetical protein n=1 Tax=Paenibacillus daejeonensis TaxID=135193 RepID=UPI00035FA34C|nr:hypothetical protein [Paenibacillus daejeonensis]